MSLSWDDRERGRECPLCAPRPESNEHWDLVAKLTTSTLYLAKNQTFRGQCQLIFDGRHAARPNQLTAEEWLIFCADLYAAEGAVMRSVQADHVNIEALGNVVPHLHWHIVPRYRHDPRWGAPIWLTDLAEMPETRLAPEDTAALLRRLRSELEAGTEIR